MAHSLGIILTTIYRGIQPKTVLQRLRNRSFGDCE